ncbi:MAG: nucleotidyltransferase domain-containing protein [Acidimicrobiales bacterium]
MAGPLRRRRLRTGARGRAAVARARPAAGLTQEEVARRAGTSQPAINRYQRGAVVPHESTTQRILRACDAGRRPSDALREHRAELVELLRRHGATTVLVFGSVARGEDTPGSDIDILVDRLSPGSYVWGIPKFQEQLEKMLGTKVDVGEFSSLRPSIAAEALADARAQ